MTPLLTDDEMPALPHPTIGMADPTNQGRWVHYYTAEQMRAYAAAAVAAERERMIADGWRQTRYVAPVTDCEACLTPDACAIRGQCGHYLRERA